METMTYKEKILAEIERLKNWEPINITQEQIRKLVQRARLGVLIGLEEFINSLPAEQPSEDLEEEIESYLTTNRQYAGGDEEDLWGDDNIRDAIKHGANWQKNRDEQMLSTLYNDCSLLKDSLDKVTTGNLPHRIGNVKFSITGMQVLIKQAMEDR